MKAIRITKNHLPVIAAETGVRKESLEVLAVEGDTYMVIGPEIANGMQTYHRSIFRDKFEFPGNLDPRIFCEVVFK